MNGDELIEAMWRVYTLHATPMPFSVREAMTDALSVVRAHDGDALAAARAEVEREKLHAAAEKEAALKAEAEAARLRAAIERALEMLAHLGIGAAEAELRAALQEGGR